MGDNKDLSNPNGSSDVNKSKEAFRELRAAERRGDLRGRLAVVTGASSGIGLQFCRTLAGMGASLLMISNRREELERCAREVARDFNVKTVAMYCDLTQPDAAEAVTRFLDSRGMVADYLINNAGIFSFLPVADTTEKKIDCFIDLHVRAVTALSREFARRFRERGCGRILNMSSMSCWTPMPGLAMYAATKAYIRVFTRSLHYELLDSNVTATAACPGGIATDLFGLPPKLMRLALRIGAVQSPEKFTRRAVDRMLRGKKQYVNGLLNRLAIPAVACTPTPVRLLVKHKMLDKDITR